MFLAPFWDSKISKSQQKVVFTIFVRFPAIFYKNCFPIGFFDYDCRIGLVSIFWSIFFFTPHRKSDTNLKKKYFLKTMVGAFCATCTINGYLF